MNPTTIHRFGKTKRLSSLVCFSLAILTSPFAVSAESTAAKKDETVELSPFVVDTTKDVGYSSKNSVAGSGFDTTLMKLPQTISIMNREMMQDLAAYNMIDSLQFVSAGVSRNGWNNGDDIYLWGFRQTNAVRDGVPQAGSGAGTLYDVDRVEAIKGPAAMLYGQAAAFGGIVNYVTRKPTRTQHVNVQAQVGSYKLAGGEAHISGPINDRLRYRVDVGALSKREARKYSFARDRFLGGGFEYDISDYATLLTNASYYHNAYLKAQTIIDPNQAFTVTVPAGTSPNFFSVEAKILQGVPDDYTVNEPWHKYDVYRYSADATLTVQLGEKLTSKTFVAYSNDSNRWIRDQQGQFRETIGGPLVPKITIANHTYSKIAVGFHTNNHNVNFLQTFLKELRTGPLYHKIVLGVDQRVSVNRSSAWNYRLQPYFNYLNPQVTPLNQNAFTFQTDPGPTPQNDNLYNLYNGSSKSWVRVTGVYLQDSISFWDDKITLMGGWRWNDRNEYGGRSFDTQSSAGAGDLVIVTNPATGLPVVKDSTIQQANVSNVPVYRYGALFAPTDNYSIYYNHSEAFQYNGGVDYLNNPLQPSIAENNEIGAKAQFFNGALGLSVTHFDMKVTNVRLTFTQGPGDPNPGNFGVRQSGFQTNKGFDFSANVSKTFDLGTLNAVATAYMGDIKNELGARPTRIANTTNSIFGSFHFAKGALTGLRVGGGTNWAGDRVAPNLVNGPNAAGVNNNNIQTRIKPYSTTNVFAAYNWGRWRVQANIDNVFDKVFIDGMEWEFWVITNPGRTFRVTFGYSY